MAFRGDGEGAIMEWETTLQLKPDSVITVRALVRALRHQTMVAALSARHRDDTLTGDDWSVGASSTPEATSLNSGPDAEATSVGTAEQDTAAQAQELHAPVSPDGVQPGAAVAGEENSGSLEAPLAPQMSSQPVVVPGSGIQQGAAFPGMTSAEGGQSTNSYAQPSTPYEQAHRYQSDDLSNAIIQEGIQRQQQTAFGPTAG